MLKPLIAALAVALSCWLGAQTPLRLDFVVGGLSRPVMVTAPSGDLQRLFVVEQSGRVRIVRAGAVLPTPFLDFTGTGLLSFGGELGLLGLAFHPNYASNGYCYVFHNGFPWPRAYVRRYTRSATDPDRVDPLSGVAILETPLVYGNHNGGMLAFGPDGKLYIGIGDGGSIAPNWANDPFNHAQRGDSLLGKLLRIDVDQPQPPLLYGIPPDNPFVGPGDPRDEIWALGLRNPWRFSFDRLNGDLWLADVGGFNEEVDFAAAGAPGGQNYGWSCLSGTYCNGGTSCVCTAPNLTPPLHQYSTPSPNAIIGGYVYRGSAIPDLRGAYFYADHMRVGIWSFRRAGATITQLLDRTTELAPPAPHFLVGPTGFGEDGHGELYLCDLAGKVYKIVPNGPVQTGVASYGAGTAGCSGANLLVGLGSPVLGNPAFGLRCNNGPVSGLGLMALAGAPDVAGSDPLGLGFVAHLQVPSLQLLLTMLGDSSGNGTIAFPIPSTASLVGYQLYAQALWLWSPAICTPSPGGWSSSNGLGITLQP
jgi:glucose/arabinose dehydrogenase